MICNKCGKKTSVLETRHSIDYKQVRRTRYCVKCGSMFHTFEFAETDITPETLENFKGWKKGTA